MHRNRKDKAFWGDGDRTRLEDETYRIKANIADGFTRRTISIGRPSIEKVGQIFIEHFKGLGWIEWLGRIEFKRKHVVVCTSGSSPGVASRP